MPHLKRDELHMRLHHSALSRGGFDHQLPSRVLRTLLCCVAQRRLCESMLIVDDRQHQRERDAAEDLPTARSRLLTWSRLWRLQARHDRRKGMRLEARVVCERGHRTRIPP